MTRTAPDYPAKVKAATERYRGVTEELNAKREQTINRFAMTLREANQRGLSLDRLAGITGYTKSYIALLVNRVEAGDSNGTHPHA